MEEVGIIKFQYIHVTINLCVIWYCRFRLRCFNTSMLLLITNVQYLTRWILKFQYIHVTINLGWDNFWDKFTSFQYIHVTINQIQVFLTLFQNNRFNTSMLLLIPFFSLLFYRYLCFNTSMLLLICKFNWPRIKEIIVSIHPCYY